MSARKISENTAVRETTGMSESSSPEAPPLPELLAPAGSPDALRAAVAAGADAVYLGGRIFSARQFAANFSDAELAEAIRYAHAHGVRVYITVNTLILDEELGEALRYLFRLYIWGADAMLVQDLGLANLARTVFPRLPLHASTQMTIHNREGAEWAARMGFTRTVLARELPADEIREIARAIPLDRMGLEVFIHGALCYCYSGQCLLSSVIGGRSGNRGMCAQPCRKPYTLLRGTQDIYGRPTGLASVALRDRYLLSTRDLEVYPQLEQIVDLGVASLKIEGRMKAPEYVAIVVDIYRRALQAIAEGRFEPSAEDERDLALAFNRGFSGGYILQDPVMGRERPGNRGLYAGQVAAVDRSRREIGLELDGGIRPERGDGIEIVSREGGAEGLGMVLRREPAERDGLLWFPVRGTVREGACVSITRRADLERRAKRILAGTRAPRQIDLAVEWDEDGTPLLTGNVAGPRGAIEVRHRGHFRMEPAVSRPLTEEDVRSRLQRTGGTGFAFRTIAVRPLPGLFATPGDLNRLRRDFLDKVREALVAACLPDPREVSAAKVRLDAAVSDLTRRPTRGSAGKVPSIACYVDTPASVRSAIEGGCRRIYLELRPPAPCSGGARAAPPALDADSLLAELGEAAEAASRSGAVLFWKWPRITRRCFLDTALPLVSAVHGRGVHGVMVEGPGLVGAVLAAEPRMAVCGSAGLNVWNHRTVLTLAPPLERLTLSPELSADSLPVLVQRVRQLASTPALEILVQGNLEAMVAEDCLPCTAGAVERMGEGAWILRDERDREFPLLLDAECRTHILNAVELCLIDHMPALFAIGLDGIAIDARGRSPRYVREMTALYRKAVDATERRDHGWQQELAGFKEEAKRMSLGGITAGHFLRGLKR